VHSFFKRNKATISFGLLGIAKTLTENYWVFNLPLVGNYEPNTTEDTTSRFFYLLGLSVINGAITGGIGYVIDRLNEIPQNSQSTELTDSSRSYQALQN